MLLVSKIFEEAFLTLPYKHILTYYILDVLDGVVFYFYHTAHFPGVFYCVTLYVN